MKLENKKLVVVAIVAIIVLSIVSAFCIFFASQMDTNVASIIGGILSVIATTVLGVIALWQNKRYKELSDEKDSKLEQLTLTPECRLLSASTVSSNIKNSNIQIAIPNSVFAGKDLNLSFVTLNLPMIDITVQRISYSYYDKSNSKKHDTFQHNQLLFNCPRFTTLENYSGFTIQTTIPPECDLSEVVCDIVLEYKNIYDITFEKAFTIKRPKNSMKFIVSTQNIAQRQGEKAK